MEKCEVFGCNGEFYRTFQVAPGTIVKLCKECYDREQKEREDNVA